MFKSPSWLPASLSKKTPYCGLRGPRDPATGLPPVPPPLALLRARRLLFLPSPERAVPRGLGTCRLLCPEWSFSGGPHGSLLHFLQLFPQKLFSPGSFLDIPPKLSGPFLPRRAWFFSSSQHASLARRLFRSVALLVISLSCWSENAGGGGEMSFLTFLPVVRKLELGT